MSISLPLHGMQVLGIEWKLSCDRLGGSHLGGLAGFSDSFASSFSDGFKDVCVSLEDAFVNVFLQGGEGNGDDDLDLSFRSASSLLAKLILTLGGSLRTSALIRRRIYGLIISCNFCTKPSFRFSNRFSRSSNCLILN